MGVLASLTASTFVYAQNHDEEQTIVAGTFEGTFLEGACDNSNYLGYGSGCDDVAGRLRIHGRDDLSSSQSKEYQETFRIY